MTQDRTDKKHEIDNEVMWISFNLFSKQNSFENIFLIDVFQWH